MANTKIPSELIADSAITAAKLADGTITTADIADSNVTTAKIADSNVTTAKIGDAQVTTAKIVDANVTTAKIADSNVTTAKILDNNITSAKLASALTLGGNTTFSGNIIKDSGDLTLDAPGDIYLDSDNANWRFNDAGTAILHISKPTGAVRLQSSVADADIIFGGIDGSTVIEALTLDMSEAGKAIFNGQVTTPSIEVGQSAQPLSLLGTDHVYMGWYPTSGAGRKAYAGFNSAGTTTFTLYNEAGGGSMQLLTGGSVTIDCGGEIILSADDNGEIVLKDGSLHYGTLLEDNSNFILRSAQNDEDILFQGYDNGGLFTALTLDMSEAGDAYFNRRVSVGGVITNTSANADDIVIGSYNDATERGITFASTTGGGIRWNDAADAGVIQYSHSSNEMYYSSTSHHRFVATTGDAAGLVRINTADAQAGVVVIKAADVTEDGIGALDLRSPNSAMRIGGTDGRSWIQSHDSQPLYLNKLGNNVIFHADGAGRVGIHHDNPLYPLHVLGTNSGAILATSTQSESTYGLIVETTVNGNPSRANIGLGSGIGLLAKIEAEQRAGGSTAYGHLAFWAADNGSLQQRMTLNYNGRLGIGLNHLDPACLVHIYETNAQNDALGLLQVQQANTTSGGSQTNASITVKNYHGTAQFMQWEENGLRLGSRITTNSGSGNLYFTTGNDNVKLTIPDSGTVIFNSNQININNSGTYPIRAATSGSVLRGAAVHHLITHDHRTPTQSSAPHGHMGFGFTSYALNNSAPWADIIYLQSYTDASGGSPNAIVVSRYASNCKIVRYPWSSTSTTAISGGTQYALAGSTSSDQRLKENVVNITNGLDTIKALRPVTFNWTDEFLQAGLSKNETEIEPGENGALIPPETKVENVGLIAQEVEEVLPTIIHENEISFGGTDYKTIHYDKIVPHLIAAIKEQDAVIQDLKTRIETLEG